MRTESVGGASPWAAAFVLATLLLLAVPPARAQGAAPGARQSNEPARTNRLIVFGDRSLPPYEFLEGGTPKGLNVDLFRAISRAMDRPITIRLVDWGAAQEAVLKGVGDMLPPVVRTPERAAQFDFTQSAWSIDFSLFARDADVERISRTNPADLSIGVAEGRYPRRHFATTYPSARLVVVADAAEGMRRLLRGDFDAFAGTTLAGRQFLRDLGIHGITEVGEPFATLDASIAVHKRNPALVARLDRAISRIKGDGTYERIIERWAGPKTVVTLTRRDLLVSAAGGGAVLLVAVLLTMLLMQRRRSRQLSAELHRRALVEGQLDAARREAEAARAAAESAARAKGEFLANMSHEIRTPMNAIVGLARLLRRGRDEPEKTEDRLRKIEGAAHHLLSLVSDVLDHAKIDAGKFELERAEFELGAVLQSVLSQVAGQAEQKGLRLIVEGEDRDQTFVGDPTRLRQALINLVSNAVKFTARGHVIIRASAEADGDAALLRFEVEDTGIGIAGEMRERIFEVFEQASAATTREYGGTGLGLSITRRLVGLMGGTIGVQSEPGVGSRFWFTARVARGSGRPRQAPSQTGRRALQALRDRFAGTRVLVAEDNEVNLEVTTALLEDAGLVAVPARNGEEAVALARKDGFALALMDMQMPVLDGMAATARIRAFRGMDTMPILALTANAFDEDRRACFDAGMNGFVSKPVDPDVLYETVLLWLERGTPRAAAGPAGSRPPDATRPHEAMAPLERLGRVAGLDVAQGLESCGGRVAQLVALLRRFADDAEASLGRLEEASQTASGGSDESAAGALHAMPDPRAILLEVHRVRGGAAALGVVHLRDRLQDLEERLRRGEAEGSALRQAVVELAGAARGFAMQLRAALDGDA